MPPPPRLGKVVVLAEDYLRVEAKPRSNAPSPNVQGAKDAEAMKISTMLFHKAKACLFYELPGIPSSFFVLDSKRQGGTRGRKGLR
jgi:hypothetical protein